MKGTPPTKDDRSFHRTITIRSSSSSPSSSSHHTLDVLITIICLTYTWEPCSFFNFAISACFSGTCAINVSCNVVTVRRDDATAAAPYRLPQVVVVVRDRIDDTTERVKIMIVVVVVVWVSTSLVVRLSTVVEYMYRYVDTAATIGWGFNFGNFDLNEWWQKRSGKKKGFELACRSLGRWKKKNCPHANICQLDSGTSFSWTGTTTGLRNFGRHATRSSKLHCDVAQVQGLYSDT